MRKGKKTLDDPYLMDLYRTGVRVRPLFGLDRLVKLAHRKRRGVLYCDNALCMSDTISFSEKNERIFPYAISHTSPSHAGVYSEPRLNVPNEASEADMKRFHDYGTQVVFSFTPKKGKTFVIETEMYKIFDGGNRYMRDALPENARIARWELTLDVSAYLRSGYSYADDEPPRCEFEDVGAKDRRGRTVRRPARELIAVEKGPGLWEWHTDNVAGGIFRLAWQLACGPQSRASKMVNLEKLAMELSINPRLAKDLHNFVVICHYHVAGLRSLNKIAAEMMTDASVLVRSLEVIEETVGTGLVRRTRGKGLILVTPSGEAVLDWWSQFYMRWTPISSDPTGPQ